MELSNADNDEITEDTPVGSRRANPKSTWNVAFDTELFFEIQILSPLETSSLDMMRILCFTGGPAATNGYLLIRPGGEAVLVDAPEGIASWPELQRVQLRGLLLTHAHFDHVLGAAAVAQRFLCPTYAFAAQDPALTLEHLAASSGMMTRLAPYRVDVLLTEATPLSLAGMNFRILHVPGHSPDSLCYLSAMLDAEGRSFLLGGDVLFQGSIGRTDFPNGDHALLLRGIREKLYTLPEATVVYPGHGPDTTIGEERQFNPYVRAL